MKQIRIGMWETNSSSLHQLAICTDPPSEIESYRNQTITVSAPRYWGDMFTFRCVGDFDLAFNTLSDRIAAMIAVWNEGGTIRNPIVERALSGNVPTVYDDYARMVPIATYLKRVANITLNIDWNSFVGVMVAQLSIGGFIEDCCGDDDTLGKYLFNQHYFSAIDDREDGCVDVRRMLPDSGNYKIYEIPVH